MPSRRSDSSRSRSGANRSGSRANRSGSRTGSGSRANRSGSRTGSGSRSNGSATRRAEAITRAMGELAVTPIRHAGTPLHNLRTPNENILGSPLNRGSPRASFGRFGVHGARHSAVAVNSPQHHYLRGFPAIFQRENSTEVNTVMASRSASTQIASPHPLPRRRSRNRNGNGNGNQPPQSRRRLHF